MAKITINIPAQAVDKVVKIFANEKDDLTILTTEAEKLTFIKGRMAAQIKMLIKQKEFEKRYKLAQEEVFNAVDEDIN